MKFELVELRALPEVLAAVKAGTVDFTGTNATPARAADMDFTPTVIDIELGFLVVPGSPVSSIADANRPGMRIAVTRGSTSQDGQWGVEHWAFAVPKGREKGMAYLRRYLEQADRSGLIARAVERSGLREAVRPR